MFDECPLKWMERAIGSESLDRNNWAVLVLHREGKAGNYTFAVDQNCARTARALVAALLCAA
jgi:hypothetical protein